MAKTGEKLSQKYLERRKQVLQSYDITTRNSYGLEAIGRLDNRSNRPAKEWKSYSRALHELFKAVANHPDHDCHPHDSKEHLIEDSAAEPLQDSQVLCTETDATLPPYLDGSPQSNESETDRSFQRDRLPDSCRSSSLVLAEVYQEMMSIYEKLRAERQSQQQWERKLQERERRLKQQEEAFARLCVMEGVLLTPTQAVEEKHQQEVDQLQDLLRDMKKQNKRLRSSFETLKELNDNMRKQLREINEQNKKLENKSKRVQARLENLQSKYEQNMALRVCQKGTFNTIEFLQPATKEKTKVSGKQSNKGSSRPPCPKLLALLLDWTLDGLTGSLSEENKAKGVNQCLPPEIILNERFLKALPLLADQLHQTPSSESDLLFNILRLIHLSLRHLDSSTPHIALSATLRRIGEQVSKRPLLAQTTMSEDEDRAKSSRSWPLYRSPCPHTRIIATLIILRTVTQADVLAQALESLHSELIAEESRGLFIHYGGVRVLLSMLHAGRGGLHTPVDILMQLTQPSRYLKSFLEACSCEEFFHAASKLLKNPHLELSSLEKLSILLQKLSSISKNRRLFEHSSVNHQIQELYHKTNRTHTFLCLNLQAILHNLQ